MTALVCVQPADLHLKEIMQLYETAHLVLFPKITASADGLWQHGYTFHLARGKKPHDHLVFLPYGSLVFRLPSSQTFKLLSLHRLVRSQNWV